MIVCMNREIAYKLYTKITDIRPQWKEERQSLDIEELTEKQRKELKPIPMINMVMTKDKDDPIDMFNALKDIDKDELDREFIIACFFGKLSVIMNIFRTNELGSKSSCGVSYLLVCAVYEGIVHRKLFGIRMTHEAAVCKAERTLSET